MATKVKAGVKKKKVAKKAAKKATPTKKKAVKRVVKPTVQYIGQFRVERVGDRFKFGCGDVVASLEEVKLFLAIAAGTKNKWDIQRKLDLAYKINQYGITRLEWSPAALANLQKMV